MDMDAPERPSAAAFVPTGMFARSWFFLRHAWALMRTDRALPAIALAGLVFNALASAAVFGLVAWLLDGWPPYGSGALMAVAAAPATVVSTYFNVALLWLAQERLEGRPRRAREGFTAANRRWKAILAWSLLATGVGALLRWIADKLPFAGPLVSWVLGVAWSLATMFAVPVLVLEDVGARRAARRSAELFRARWGEGVTGQAAVTGITVVGALPGVLLVVSGIAFGGEFGIALAVVGGLLLGTAAALAGAMRELYALAIYRHQVLGETSFGLEPSELDALAVLKPRGPRR